MSGIVVATDFSTRSDRAIRRAVLLAKGRGSPLTLVHVVDDDQPAGIIASEVAAASALLDEQARSLREHDGVECDPRIVRGDPFAGIAAAVEDCDAELLVIGPHRRQVLRDIFVGTTAERTIRASRRPVLMANGVPAGAHRHTLIAVDLSPGSADAVRAAIGLGFAEHTAVSVLHVFDAPGIGPVAGAALTARQAADYLAGEERPAGEALARFLAEVGLAPDVRLLKPGATAAASVILATAQSVSADLVVVGTRGRTGMGKLLLGSVAEAVMGAADVDVMAVPPRHGD